MNNEYEIVNHPRIKYVNPFLVSLSYRTPHLHQDFEICLLLEGELSVYTRNESFHVNKNAIFLFNPIQLHELRAVQGSALILSIQISHKFCSNYFPALANTVFHVSNLNDSLSAEEKRTFLSLIFEMGYVYFEEKFGFELACLSLLNRLFYQLLHAIPHHNIGEEERAANIQRLHRVNRIVNYIEENYSSKLLLSTIAEREGLSLAYLSHFFKKNLNTTFQDYLNQVRFEKAKQLIVQTDMKLIDISLECGFSDTRYLNNMFVKQFGCSPKQYRAEKHQFHSTHPAVSIDQSFYSVNDSLKIMETYRQQLLDQGVLIAYS